VEGSGANRIRCIVIPEACCFIFMNKVLNTKCCLTFIILKIFLNFFLPHKVITVESRRALVRVHIPNSSKSASTWCSQMRGMGDFAPDINHSISITAHHVRFNGPALIDVSIHNEEGEIGITEACTLWVSMQW